MILVISGAILLSFLIQIIVAGLIFGLIWWLISYIGLPAPFAKVVRVVLAVAAVLYLINAILSIFGTPFIRW